jgi:hypothetical protein
MVEDFAHKKADGPTKNAHTKLVSENHWTSICDAHPQ